MLASGTEGVDRPPSVFLMLRGMTGYGRATCEGSLGQITIELSSLNRRHLDVRTSLPPYLLCLESNLRESVRRHIERGAIVVTLQVQYRDVSSLRLEPNQPVLGRLKQAMDKVAAALEIEREVALAMITKRTGEMIVDPELDNLDEHRALATRTMKQALVALVETKLAEGSAIADDIKSRIRTLGSLSTTIQKQVPLALETHRDRIRRELAAVGATGDLREVVASLDKGDVTEELVRIAHHLTELELAIDNPARASGRSLEFRLQEVLREFNTIGSKAGDIVVADAVVNAKTELEKIREQLQNVE